MVPCCTSATLVKFMIFGSPLFLGACPAQRSSESYPKCSATISEIGENRVLTSTQNFQSNLTASHTISEHTTKALQTVQKHYSTQTFRTIPTHHSPLLSEMFGCPIISTHVTKLSLAPRA